MFENRDAAGHLLAQELVEMAPTDPVVLALPRGGIAVALPVARALDAPLDLLLVRKIGLPGHTELAAGAVVDGEDLQAVFNASVLRMAGLAESDFADAIKAKKAEIDERRRLYLGGRAPVSVEGRSAVVVDDGIATGATVKAALLGLKRRRPGRIILAVPVAPRDVTHEMRALVDDYVCLEMPPDFYAVGAHYREFGQVSDEEVKRMLNEYWSEREGRA